MHFYRRKEAFRYCFAEPLIGRFELSKIDQVEIESRTGDIKIIDISLNGAKISTPFDFRVENKEIEITLHFQIMSISFSIPGFLIYQKRYLGDYHYGVKLNTDSNSKEKLMKELKAYAWSLVRQKSQ